MATDNPMSKKLTKTRTARPIKRLVRRRDGDLLSLERCCQALDRLTPRMLKANLDFLVDRYITHPNVELRRAGHLSHDKQKGEPGIA